MSASTKRRIILKKSNQNENQNLYCEIEIRQLSVALLLINQAIKDKETMKQSN